MSIKAEIQRGTSSTLLLGDGVFRSQWHALYQRCPWATVFQSLDYLGIWYEVYHPRYEPVLVVSPSICSGLTGLLPLAVSRSTRSLIIAGSPNTEYYGWLSLSETSDTFILAALDALQVEFPEARLDFRFLPPGTPLDWLHASKWSRRCELASTPRPLMAIGDGSKSRESLRKKHNKTPLKRLERLGNLEFERVRTFSEIQSDFYDIMNYCDLRQGAVNNSLPFRNDPYKRLLFAKLFDVPELLHATVWRLNGKVISAHIGLRSHDHVLLGLIAHSPFLAKHSPGKLHILHLGLLLAEELIGELDLTPEGSYKDLFATHSDEVHRLTVFFSRTGLLRKKIIDLTLRVAKRALSAMSVSPQRAREIVARRQHELRMLKMSRRPVKAIISILRKPRSSRQRLTFRFEAGQAAVLSSSSLPIRQDDLNDLLTYRPLEAGDPPVQNFLSGVLERLERGDHVYTWVSNGLLVYCAWLREIRSPPDDPQIAAQQQFPVGSILIDQVHVYVEENKRELLSSLMNKILLEVATMGKEIPIYAIVSENDVLFRGVLEGLCFRRVSTVEFGDRHTNI